jgi:DeoR/GlpR family transcriptional regulator of sugar metabolism
MLMIERQNRITALLHERPVVTVNDLTEELGVSGATVRKMLAAMENQGLLRRTHGGAVSLTLPTKELDFSAKAVLNVQEKRAIAKKAYTFIRDHETVYLDAGTTTLELVRCIRSGPKRNLVVVTNAIAIADELLAAADIAVILVGGELRHGVRSCVGSLAEAALGELHFDRAFIAANNLSLRFGATTPNPSEAKLKRKAFRRARKGYLLVDSSKFRGNSLSKICDVADFFAVITDRGLSAEQQREFSETGVNVVLA